MGIRSPYSVSCDVPTGRNEVKPGEDKFFGLHFRLQLHLGEVG